jgi:anti-sigma B factor antagonist
MDDVLTIVVRREHGYVIVEVTGELDISTVTGLRERLFELAEGSQPLIVDLNRITFIDSAGLGALVGAARRAEARPSRPRLTHPVW